MFNLTIICEELGTKPVHILAQSPFYWPKSSTLSSAFQGGVLRDTLGGPQKSTKHIHGRETSLRRNVYIFVQICGFKSVCNQQLLFLLFNI